MPRWFYFGRRMDHSLLDIAERRQSRTAFHSPFLENPGAATADGIETYFGSGMIGGIVPVYAKRLAKAFGKDVFDIIKENRSFWQRVRVKSLSSDSLLSSVGVLCRNNTPTRCTASFQILKTPAIAY